MQERGLTKYSEFGPPLLNQQNGSAVGIKVRKANIVSSFAQFVSSLENPVNSDGLTRSLSTFGQVVWELSRNTKLSLLGMHRQSRPSSQNISLGELAFPISIHKHDSFSETSMEEGSPTNRERSIALMFNSELDDSAKIGVWIQTRNSNSKILQWGFTMSDTPEDELGWGLSLGGVLEGRKRLEHFQVETFFNLNFGNRFTLQPGLVFVKDGGTQFPALVLRSSWSL